MTLNEENKQTADKGIQPLDEIMKQLELSNSDLVKCPGGTQITYKMAAKARKGRRLSRNVQMKILSALNACQNQNQKQYMLKDIFNY